MPDPTAAYPDRLADATEAYMARCRVPFEVRPNSAYALHREARVAACGAEVWHHGGSQRLPCCAPVGGLAQLYAHVASFRHIAAVFAVDEAALRTEVRAWRERGDPPEEE